MLLVDHNLVVTPYIASEDADTLDALFRGKEVELERESIQPLSSTESQSPSSVSLAMAAKRQRFIVT